MFHVTRYSDNLETATTKCISMQKNVIAKGITHMQASIGKIVALSMLTHNMGNLAHEIGHTCNIIYYSR